MLGWELPPYHTGGLGIACYQLCKYLSSEVVDISFILPFDAEYQIDFMQVNPVFTEQESASLPIYPKIYESSIKHIGSSSASSEEFERFQDYYVSRAMKIMALGNYDILHAHDWLTFRAAMAAKMISNKPLVVHVHATEFDRSGGRYGNPLVREIEYSGMMMADQIIAVSEHTKRTIVEQYSIPESKISVVHNRLDIHTEELDPKNNYQYLQQLKNHGFKIVLSAGRLTIQKGLTHLFEAMRLVVEKRPKSILLVVGNGEQYEQLIESAAAMGISQNVLFTGFLNGTGKDWRDAFRISDLFVMPSVSEPFGITPLESISFGTPALVSKTIGASELINNMLNVDFWDVEKMADQILASLNYPSLTDSLLTNAQEELANLSWHDAARDITHIYHRHKVTA